MTSANIVGYDTESVVDGKLNMKGVMFSAVSGEAIDLNKDVKVANLVPGEDETRADQILVYRPATSSYITYYYYNAEGDEENWGWTDVNWEESTQFPAGTGFWFKGYIPNGGSAKDKTITISGAVETDEDITFSVVDGKLNMLSNPFPTALDLNDSKTIDFVNNLPGEDETSADQILIYRPSRNGYITYYNYNAEGDEENWGWTDVNWEESTVIPAGAGFWYKGFKKGDAKEKKVVFKKAF